ncbi:hypothetical protein KAW50_03645 [candidate division WOR-3 bacterium]|nr:hypothetical protein [candidate division WOR-3 bacterium]
MPKKNVKVDLDELANLSGESTVKSFKYTVPLLKFNGNTGKFGLLTPDSEGNYVPKELGDKAHGVILKIRRVYSAYEKGGGDPIRMYTNEHNSRNDDLVLFEARGSTKSRLIDHGTGSALREKYSNLRLKQNLYFLFDGDVVKLRVGGKSLASLFEYYRDFGTGEHIFQYETQITCHQETNEGGLSYYVMDFAKSKKTDIESISEKIKEVAMNIESADQSYGQQRKEPEEKPATESVIQTEEGSEKEKNGEKEIDIKDIPF